MIPSPTQNPLRKLNQTSLKTRALLISSIPVMVIGIVLAILFTSQRFHELDKTIEKQGEILATAFSHSLFESMTQKQGHAVPFYAQRILEEPNVRSVAVYQKNGDKIAHTGPAMRALDEKTLHIPNQDITGALSRLTDSTLRIIHPIRPASTYHPLAGDHAITGWLEVEIDRSNLVIEKYRSLLYMVGLLVVALTTNALIAVRFSGNIDRVIQSIQRALQEMSKGNLETRLEENAYGELKLLQNELNQLGHSILEGQQELQQSVDQATEDLRETLETIEIQNIELDLARKEALEASRIKSEFLANMSHEIRTPLNGIIGFTNLLRKSDVSVTQRDYLETIQKSSESLLSIINDILDFSKIEAGKLVLDQIPLNFQEVVEDVLTMLAPMAQEKHLEQVSLFYSDVPTGLIGDPLRLKQILTNLVNNAVKFTDHGEVVVRVMLDDVKDKRVTIKVTVTDTGIGLSKEQQRALFSAFRQADTTTARRFGGTGLGLVISKHLVEQMRGEIGLESEPGKGSTFWFTFRAEEHNKDNLHTPLMINAPCNIAIFDSNATVRANLRNTLQKRKVDITECSDIASLRHVVQTQPQQLQAIIFGINSRHPQYSDVVALHQLIQNRIPLIVHGSPFDQNTLTNMLGRHPLPIVTKPLCQQRTYEVLAKLIDSDAFDSASPANKNTPPKTDKTASSLHIIAVDDNTANLKLLCALLEDLSINVTPCDSGIKALQSIAKKAFDLVLLDIQMPVMDGVETAHRIRNLDNNNKNIPIIAVTAHALASEKYNLLNSGMDDYVTKPINEAQLIHIIHKWTGVNLIQPEIEQNRIKATQAKLAQPVDMTLGIKLANNKSDLAEEMLDMLFSSLQRDREVICQLSNKKEYGALQDAVHKLHGATRYTGVPFLQEASQALEECLKLQHTRRAHDLVAHLLMEIDRVIHWYKTNRDTTTVKSP